MVGGVVLSAAALVTVFPTRTYLSQRQELSAERERLSVLREQNTRLAARVKKLHTPQEIERLAREQYNLVKPGEEAYAILPSPSDGPEDNTFAKKKEKKAPGFWQQVGDTITFWD